MNGFLSDDKIKMDQIHGNMIWIYIQSSAEPLCVLPAFIPQAIFYYWIIFITDFFCCCCCYLFQIVRVVSPSHKISFLHYNSIIAVLSFGALLDSTLNVLTHMVRIFFRFKIPQLLLLSISEFWIFVKILHFICNNTNPVQFQTREVKKRISFWC